MAIYTGVADANGDFTVPFSSNYTSGQKVTVIAEKDSATKSIELYAPSDVIGGGGVIQFSGTFNNFPNNIGDVEISADINDSIAEYGFYVNATNKNLGYYATGLKLNAVTNINALAFYGWVNATTLVLPETLIRIYLGAFQNWKALQNLSIPDSVQRLDDACFRGCTALTSLTIGSGVTYIGSAFYDCSALMSITCLADTPPQSSSSFTGVPASCKIFVPPASLDAYKSAPGWSARSAYIQAM
jgi:BspA type Leucine rich repeat region (6 copies)